MMGDKIMDIALSETRDTKTMARRTPKIRLFEVS